MLSHTPTTLTTSLNALGCVSYGSYIRIRPKYRDDSGIHAHEQAHANQWWAGTTALSITIMGWTGVTASSLTNQTI